MKTFCVISTAVILLLGLSAAPFDFALAQDKQVVDLTNLLCKDVMRSSGVERNSLISFLNGYLLGTNKISKFSPQEVAESVDHFIEYCLDNPNTKALEALSKFRK
jgi:hypothetical protein